MPASRPWWRRSSWERGRTTGGRLSCRTTCRSCCWGRAFPGYYAILWRSRTRLDDSLDVSAAHGIGGLVGALLTGVFAQAAWGGADGLLSGKPGQLAVQAAGVLAAVLYSGIASLALLKV